LDGGAWIGTTETSVTLLALSEGSHTIEVRGLCGCANGTIAEEDFNIVAPSSACSSVVTITAVSQNGSGSASVSFTSTGPATSWQYAVDGGSFVAVPSNPFNITGLSIDSHSVEVRPVCTGGAIGTSDTALFDITEYQPVYWYEIRFGANPCGSTPVVVYSLASIFTTGAILFTDENLINPVAGPPGGYVAAYDGSGFFTSGQVFVMNASTVEFPTGSIC
jgi:hypothetical protein